MEIAQVRVQYEYRRIHVLLKREGWKLGKHQCPASTANGSCSCARSSPNGHVPLTEHDVPGLAAMAEYFAHPPTRVFGLSNLLRREHQQHDGPASRAFIRSSMLALVLSTNCSTCSGTWLC